MTTLHAQPSNTPGHGTPSAAASAAASSSSPAHTTWPTPDVARAVDVLVDAVRQRSSVITADRPADPARATSYAELLARAAEVRGRPLLFPMIATGAGNGPLLELADGSVKWDMIAGIGVHFFGHADPDLIRAAAFASLDSTVKHGNLSSTFDAYAFSETLLAMAKKNSRLRHAYIATGGAMANENALKVCLHQRHIRNLRAVADAGPDAKIETLLAKTNVSPRILAFKDCFMGRSIVMANIGDNHAGREGLPGALPVDYMPFYDPAAAERMGPGPSGKKRFIDMALWHLDQYVHRHPGAHACFIFELVQGEGGFNVGDRDYFLALMEYCKAHTIAVWDDEIQSFGRTERLFAYELFDLGHMVDVFCVGKMTQACATAWTEEFNPKTTILSGTFTGEGVSFRVGTRVLERLRDGDFYGPQGQFARHHALFREHAHALVARHPDWFPITPSVGSTRDALVSGIGGMMRLTPFGGDKDKVSKATRAIFDEGVVLLSCGHGPYHVRMLPPLPAMRPEFWPRIFECIEKGLAKVAG
jgi:acetylornithine aminotransferase